MTDSATQQIVRPHSGRHSSAVAACTAAATLAFAALLATMAFAASTLTVGSASNSKLGERVAVNPQGRTLYALSPETTSHLLCKSNECLKVWPPLTVHSRATKLEAGTGVEGHLGILRRSNGMLQVTLRGHPLYRYSGDHADGQANGQDLESFGGTWHALTASSTTPATPTAPTPAPASPNYEY
jgi:predicted lipoprotein with Yx(FWY)xxD motif